MEILAASFQNETCEYSFRVRMMKTAIVRVIVKARHLIPLANAGFTLFDRMNNIIFSAGIAQQGKAIISMKPGEEKVITFRVQLSVKPDTYTFALGCAESEFDDLNHGRTHHRLFGFGPLEIYTDPDAVLPFHGIASLAIDMSVQS
jgi:hypothetical protein